MASELGVALILSGDDYLSRFELLNAMRNQVGEVVLADLMLLHANSAPWDYEPMSGEGLSFPGGLDTSFTFGPDNRWRGYFGRDVLSGLISGIDEFHAVKARERRFRVLGSALLGAFLWLDDPQLVQRIADFPYACVVITKQPRDRRQQARLDTLQALLQHSGGFPAAALPELEYLVQREDGEVPVIGPGSPRPDVMLPALRTIGYRRTANRLVPILHTKMVLLGEVWWHDEDGLGNVADVTGFRPQQLWVASANGTASSRGNLECGFWLHDPALLREAQKFLTRLLRHSEDFDPDADLLEPDLVEPDYDDEAFAEAVASMPDWDDYEDEPE